jgi:hypothetical protein
MDNNTLQIKFKQRLNKQASFDYDNIECWQIAEAFNKAQIEWVRRQIHPTPTNPEFDESSKMQIDDIQPLLLGVPIPSTKQDLYYETSLIPADYLYFKRLTVKAKSGCCPDRTLVVFLEQVADVDILLSDEFRKPSLEWGETFCTLQSNRIRVYTNNEFDIANPVLTYYRKPREVRFAGCVDIATGASIATDVTCEFKDDVVEVILDSAIAILAGDIESMNQYTRGKQESINNE